MESKQQCRPEQLLSSLQGSSHRTDGSAQQVPMPCLWTGTLTTCNVAMARPQELPSVSIAAVRHYLVPQGISFTEDVSIAKAAIKGDAPPVLDSWKSQAQETAQLMKLMQTYKDLGDSKNEPLLKFHNPRTFEDLTKPVPNFRAQNLKAGEVPRFFDNVLMGRAQEAVDKKNEWWAQRKAEAQQAATGASSSAFTTVPVPSWSYGKSVTLDSLKAVTDKYIASMEPKRKLHLAPLPAQVKDSLSAFAASLKQDKSGAEITEVLMRALAEKAVVVENNKPLEDFKFMSKAVAARAVAARRAQVHDRYVKYWAKKVLVSPELAAVPLKHVDAQLASKFENVAPKYADLLCAAGAGGKTYGQRVASAPAFSTFLLKRETPTEVAAEVAPVEQEAEGAALAAKLDDPLAALKQLLGPEMEVLGAAGTPLSAQVRAITEHKYTPDRYMYKEGMALAARLEAEEASARAAGHDPRHPPTPIQQIMQRMKQVEGQGASFAAERSAADSAYMAYAVGKKHEFLSNASNIELEEVVYPQLVAEALDQELAELAEAEAAIQDAEEEELWHLTLAAQLKHLQKHFGVDLPHGVIAYMDPVLVKKVDWETTNNLADWDISLEDMGAEYAKEQWGLESLSHHLLPLIRYRRAKARAQGSRYDAERAGPLR